MNYNGLQDSFLDYWKVVADNFANNPYVIGFDPLNEPLVSFNSIENFLSTVVPSGVFDKEMLQPLYANIYKILQKPD